MIVLKSNILNVLTVLNGLPTMKISSWCVSAFGLSLGFFILVILGIFDCKIIYTWDFTHFGFL